MEDKKDNIDDKIDDADLLDFEEDSQTEEASDFKEPVNVDLLVAENKKLKEDFLRAYADAENTKRRCQQEIEKNNKYAISSFAKELLSVADNLARAIDSVSEEEKPANEHLLKGVKLTQEELKKVLAKFGIIKMDIIGKIFDPHFHQVVQEIGEKTKPAGTIIAEVQAGYMINDRILREAIVVVTK